MDNFIASSSESTWRHMSVYGYSILELNQRLTFYPEKFVGQKYAKKRGPTA